MSTQYEALKNADLYPTAFRVEPPAELGERKMTPRKPGFFITRSLSGITDAQRTALRNNAASQAEAPAAAEQVQDDNTCSSIAIDRKRAMGKRCVADNCALAVGAAPYALADLSRFAIVAQ